MNLVRKLTDREIIVASHNAGKVGEITDLIAPFGITAKSAAELGLAVPEETGATFEANAAIKAHAAAKATGLPALGDDSGLCVDALGGAPGIHTADWAEKPDGSGRDFAFAMQRIEQALNGKGARNPVDRAARFVAVLCLAWPDGHKEHFRGEIEGTLIWPPRGDKGFGYDPIFLPQGHTTSFGEMTAPQKHGWNPEQPELALSHRARAFAQLAQNCLVQAG